MRSPVLALWAIVLWWGILCLGCDSCAGGSSTASTEEAEVSSATARASASVAPSASAPAEIVFQVRLLSTGEEPRQPLRYKFHVDRPESVSMDLHMTAGMEIGAAKQPETETPGLRLAMSLTPTALTADGTLQYNFRIDSIDVLKEPGVRPDMVTVVEGQVGPLVGLSGSAEVDPRGITRSVQFVVPPWLKNPSVQTLIDNLKQSIRSIASPLPEEPVGKGAQWEIAVPIDTPTVKLKQVAVHTLKELKSDRGKMDIDLRQEAPRQPVAFPGMHAGATATLDALDSSGSGKVEFDLNKLVPESNVNLRTTMTVKVEEQNTVQMVKMTVKVQVKTGKALAKK